jgi:uncharacterized DUF497 family protein
VVPVQFEWDDDNSDHLESRHRISPIEAQQAMIDSGRVPSTARRGFGERRYAAIGATDAGRVLHVVFIRKPAAIRVISARDATASERRRYRRVR